jgi:2'-hydroxyisoflavone reductase
MRILILGGTVFLGRHLVRAAVERGHTVTTFNRGTVVLDEQKDVERLHGDRNSNVQPLRGRRWDAAIDTCGYKPADMGPMLEMLAGMVSTYSFVSSISVYDSFKSKPIDERHAVRQVELGTNGDYGSLKALCEQAVVGATSRTDVRAQIIRPGLIVGPYDSTDRFTYWPSRIARGGKVLAPGRPDRALQFIDARDLAEWMIRMVEEPVSGTFNVTGPAQPISMTDFLEQCKSATGSDAEFVWVGDRKLAEQGIGQWIEMPLWIPDSEEESRHFMEVDISVALKHGLTFRPLAQTIVDTLEWDRTRPPGERQAGLSAEREQAAIAAASV